MKWNMIPILFLMLTFAACESKDNLKYSEDSGWTPVRSGSEKLFWWHFQRSNVVSETRPLIIWLQGGPGQSGSGFGNYGMLGPKDLAGKARQLTWLDFADLLFVDSPVGTGLSAFADPTQRDSPPEQPPEQVVADLKDWLDGLGKQKPELRKQPLYVVGFSYGAKPAMSMTAGLLSDKEWNIQSVIIVSGLVDPPSIFNEMVPFALSKDLVSRPSEPLTALEEAVEQYNAGKAGVGPILDIYKSMLFPKTLENYKKEYGQPESTEECPVIFFNESALLNVRKLIKNSGIKLGDFEMKNYCMTESDDYLFSIGGFITSSVLDDAKKIVASTRVSLKVISGSYDAQVTALSANLWIEKSLSPAKAEKWKQLQFQPLSVDNQDIGSYKALGNIEMIEIPKSGHYAPIDQPLKTYLAVKRFVGN